MLQVDSNNTVVVPEIVCPLDDEVLEELQRAVDPLEPLAEQITAGPGAGQMTGPFKPT